MTSWPVLDVAVGLAFLYFLLSLVCSTVNEAVSSIFGLRAKTLEQWIASVVADPDILDGVGQRLDEVLAAGRAVEPLRDSVRNAVSSGVETVEQAKAAVESAMSARPIPGETARTLQAGISAASSVGEILDLANSALTADGALAAAKRELVVLVKNLPIENVDKPVSDIVAATSFDQLGTAVEQIRTAKSLAVAAVDRFYASATVRGLSKQPTPRRTTSKARKPSYLPASAAVATFLSSASGGPVDKASFDRVVANLPPVLQRVAESYAEEIGGDIHALRQRLENYFDDAMQRVSGWYKRRVQLILAVIAVLVAGALNADTIAIADTLWTDPTVRSVVTAQATAAVDKANTTTKTPDANGSTETITTDANGNQTITTMAGSKETTTTTDAAGNVTASPPSSIRSELDDAYALGLPLGWGRDAAPGHQAWNLPTSLHGWLSKLAGLLLTAFALLLGAPFWFDLLSQFVRLRGGGEIPKATVQPAPGSGP